MTLPQCATNLKAQSHKSLKRLRISFGNSCCPVASSIFVPQDELQLTVTRKSNHYLKRRGERWHYYRHVPNKYAAVDPRGTIRIALDTDSVLIAREKRDRIADADEALWRTSYAGLNGLDVGLVATRQRHQVAQARALALGFSFKSINELLASDNVMEIVERVETIAQANDQMAEAEVLLGTIAVPKLTVREALELFLTTLTIGERKGESPDQLRKWRLQHKGQ